MKHHSPVNVIIRMKNKLPTLYITNITNNVLTFSVLENEAKIMPHCCAVELLEKHYGPQFYVVCECVLSLDNKET